MKQAFSALLVSLSLVSPSFAEDKKEDKKTYELPDYTKAPFKSLKLTESFASDDYPELGKLMCELYATNDAPVEGAQAVYACQNSKKDLVLAIHTTVVGGTQQYRYFLRKDGKWVFEK